MSTRPPRPAYTGHQPPRSRQMRVTLGRVGTALAATAVAAVVVACSSSSKSSSPAQGASGQKPPSVPMASSVGAGEGALNIIAWAGYAESGQNDPKVDWVHPFEQQTGCKVNVKIGNTSDEMVQLMRTGQYDGVSASGDATLRLIYAGDVAPVNTELSDWHPGLLGRGVRQERPVQGESHGV